MNLEGRHLGNVSDLSHLEGVDRTVAQMWELFFGPEVERRRALGLISEEFSIYMAQVIFPPEGKTKVLLNDEILGEAIIRSPRPIQEGQTIYLSDLQYIERFDLPNEFLDNGHFTVIVTGENLRVFFNFRAGRAKAKDMLELAGQFLEAALSSRKNSHAGPSVDNLFSACELISKAELILHRNPAVKSKNHGMISSAINTWSRLGNIDAAFVKLFNKLSGQRPNARYGDRENRPPIPDENAYDLVRAMIERGLERVGKTTDLAIEPNQKATS